MIYKVYEYVYLKKDKYTFKEELIIDNSKRIYCLVAINGDVVHCLLQLLFEKPTKDEKDKAIKEYLKNKRRLISFEYKNAKPFIELTSYKVGE